MFLRSEGFSQALQVWAHYYVLRYTASTKSRAVTQDRQDTFIVLLKLKKYFS